ncbi:MAG: hypothetical protein RIC16_05310 [Rhodospirillales bacterium]
MPLFEVSDDPNDSPVWRRESRAFSGLKSALLGALCGGVIVVVVGFTLGGWVTSDFADDRARDEAARQVIATKAAFCVGRLLDEPDWKRLLLDIHGMQSFARPMQIARAGWATMPGTKTPDKVVAAHCADAVNRIVVGGSAAAGYLPGGTTIGDAGQAN